MLGKARRSSRPSAAGWAGGRLELARNKVSSELGSFSWWFTVGWRSCGVASLGRQHGAALDLGSIPPLLLSGFGWIWDLFLCFSFFPFFFSFLFFLLLLFPGEQHTTAMPEP